MTRLRYLQVRVSAAHVLMSRCAAIAWKSSTGRAPIDGKAPAADMFRAAYHMVVSFFASQCKGMFRHLTAQNETYMTHLRMAWGLAATAAWASVCLLAHGVLPSVLSKSGGDALLAAADKVRDRRGQARLITRKNFLTNNGNKQR